MELKVTSERVKEAAASCKDADKVLRKLFPEAFKPTPVPVDLTATGLIKVGGTFLTVRNGGNFAYRAVYLPSNDFRWEIEVDEAGYQCLLAYKHHD